MIQDSASAPEGRERRTKEAASLREFFDEQIHHLQKLLSDMTHHREVDRQQEIEDRKLVEAFVDASNKKMRVVRDYEKRLRHSVQGLYAHIQGVAEDTSPPVCLDTESFIRDPFINSLFVNKNEINELFQADPKATHFLRKHPKYEVPTLYAFLNATRYEKRTLGMGMMGDMVVRDVPQEEVNFTSHKIIAPSATREELASSVKTDLFCRTVEMIKREMDTRAKKEALQSTSHSYEARIHSLANPDVYIDALVDFLSPPEALLNLETQHLRLNKMGFKLREDSHDSANEFDFQELVWGDGKRNVILSFYHPRSEL